MSIPNFVKNYLEDKLSEKEIKEISNKDEFSKYTTLTSDIVCILFYRKDDEQV